MSKQEALRQRIASVVYRYDMGADADLDDVAEEISLPYYEIADKLMPVVETYAEQQGDG